MSVRYGRRANQLMLVVALAGCGHAASAGLPASAGPSLARPGDVLTRAQIARLNPGSMVELLDRHFLNVMVSRAADGPRLLIRGEADALVVVDELPLANPQEIWLLEPNDIEQIRILKGPATVAFGSRGSHGVVQITTRRR